MSLRIVFMGTPEFAVPSLEILVENNLNIVGVITAPDKPAGRGMKLQQSAVKQCALKHDLNVLQPTNLKSPEFIAELKALNANLQIVVAFRMLPVAVWDMPEIGTFNLHGSLLPKYRGAAPINWAIMNGEKETGVTTFFLKHQIDTGDIIMQSKESILETDDVGSLYGRLMNKGAGLVLETVKLIETGEYQLQAQDLSLPTPKAPKIHTPDCEINLEKPSKDVINFIRGLSPYPGAWLMLPGGKGKYKIFRVGESDLEGDKLIETDNQKSLCLKTQDGYINILEIQAPGKRRMQIEDFLRGNKF